MRGPASVPGVVEVTEHQPVGEPRGWLLVELPHGATRREEYDAVAARMKSALPAQLEHFFFVNTDIGTPEGAAWLGEALAARGVGVVVTRCRFPRTFIDANRVLARTTPGVVVAGLTPGLPGYIDHPEDVAWLEAQHAAYHREVAEAYALVCGERRGLALQLHSYAPRSVSVERTDGGIVDALHRAYEPQVYETWPRRPDVDLICATEDGRFRAAPALVEATVAAYSQAGIAAAQNGTYHLHPSTAGLQYAQAWPEQVLCVELSRGEVAEPFVPFGVSPISPARVARMMGPLAEVLGSRLGAR